MKLMRRAALAFLVAVPTPMRLAAQSPAPPSPDAPWDSVTIAWDEGRYPDALTRIIRLLSGPAADRYRERAALLTGELFRTTDVAPDGRTVKWSPGGRYASIEVGLAGARHTLLLRWENDAFTRVADLPGFGLVFAPGDGFAAFVTSEGVRDISLADGTQRAIPTAILRLRPRGLAYAPGGALIAAAASPNDTTGQLYELGPETPVFLTGDAGGKTIVAATNDAVVYTINRDRIGIQSMRDTAAGFRGLGVQPALSPDGRTVTFVARNGAEYVLTAVPVTGGEPRAVLRRPYPLASPAWSPDGRWLAFQVMPREDWEITLIAADGSGERRLTREIQHDLLPVFVNAGTVLEKIGEARHRRSYLIDLASGERTRLFHNNTVRTVAPEYAWAPSPDGNRILIVADRDGNTVSPERGVYLTDLTRQVSVGDVLARARASLEAENLLRARSHRMFAGIAPAVRAALAEVSVPRIDRYAADLFSFDSKFITQPGNRRAINYIAAQLRSFGYEPVLQEFEPRPGVPSANIIATLRGTVDPDLTYVVSSHFDSVEPGPGADDDATGTTQMLEAARVLARRPQRTSIQFAFFTGEEAGLLGSREFVRRARPDSVHIVGALNNDMVGWRNDARFDNTIRYSNDGLRDLEHAAALEFTRLILYDSRYYQSTDAAAFYEGWGDIVGGIGSYPILGNPHYHQSHDVLETIDQRLVAEVAKTTIASLMLMASSPSRLAGLTLTRANGRVVATWQPAKEHDVVRYLVQYGPEGGTRTRASATATRIVLGDLAAGTVVEVKAVMRNGLEGWDWARGVVPAR